MRVAERLRVWVPNWWRGEGGVPGRLLDVALAPAELGFRAIVATRNRMYDMGLGRTYSAPVPVVSVGNLTAGGTGKTPIAAWIAARLTANGGRPAIVRRGYGADEALLHAVLNPSVPVYSDRRRRIAIEAAIEGGADCIVLDDGFQHRGVGRNLDLVLVAADTAGRPERMFPRGPHRESLDSLRRADFVLVTRKAATLRVAEEVLGRLQKRRPGLPGAIVHLALEGFRRLPDRSETVRAEHFGGRDVLAVTSIAEPGAFHEALLNLGARVVSFVFPDHHDFSEADLIRIRSLARGRPVVMTGKDAVKLGHRMSGLDAFEAVQAVRIESGLASLDSTLKRLHT